MCPPAPSQIYLRFLEYQMENSNECKKNFVAVYDGSNAIEDLKVSGGNQVNLVTSLACAACVRLTMTSSCALS